MMKKISLLFVLLSALLLVTGCNENKKKDDSKEDNKTVEKDSNKHVDGELEDLNFRLSTWSLGPKSRCRRAMVVVDRLLNWTIRYIRISFRLA